jgi:hypothetical protein
MRLEETPSTMRRRGAARHRMRVRALAQKRNLPPTYAHDAETLRRLAEKDEKPTHAVKGNIDANELRTRRGYPD